MDKKPFKIDDKVENINKLIEDSKKTSGARYRIKLTENNKTLILNKKSLQVMANHGINLDKNYISYKKDAKLYNTIYKIVTVNDDYFMLQED